MSLKKYYTEEQEIRDKIKEIKKLLENNEIGKIFNFCVEQNCSYNDVTLINYFYQDKDFRFEDFINNLDALSKISDADLRKGYALDNKNIYFISKYKFDDLFELLMIYEDSKDLFTKESLEEIKALLSDKKTAYAINTILEYTSLDTIEAIEYMQIYKELKLKAGEKKPFMEISEQVVRLKLQKEMEEILEELKGEVQAKVGSSNKERKKN